MKLWDLDDKLLFPPGTIVAYAKNVLAAANSRVEISEHVATYGNYHVLKGTSANGRETEFYAPFVKRNIGEMFIPMIMQRSWVYDTELSWSADGRKSRGCTLVARQDDDEQIRMLASRYAFIRYARSAKPKPYTPGSNDKIRVQDLISKELDKAYMDEQFRFVDNEYRPVVVPFVPVVLNNKDQEEPDNGFAAPVSNIERLAIASR